mgnify:CR=1 FL=1
MATLFAGIIALSYTAGAANDFRESVSSIKDKSITCDNYQSYKNQDKIINDSLKANKVTPFTGSLVSKIETLAYTKKFDPPKLGDLQTKVQAATENFRNGIAKLGLSNSENVLNLIKTLTGLSDDDVYSGDIDPTKGLIGSIVNTIVEPIGEMSTLNNINLIYAVIMLGLVIFYILIQ